VMVNNHDWLGKLGYIELLQSVGAHFTINRMLTFDSVKLRLEREQPMTFLEFNYMILQGYDFRHLSKTLGVRLQMGGSDQWGNIINGVELARRMDGAEVFGVTTPLITKSDGTKMGKSVSGAVWLNREQLPDYDYWQFWRNTDDRDVGRLLRLFTDLPLGEIVRLEALEGSEINAAKIALANAATEMCRGADAATLAEDTARKVFAEGVAGDDLPIAEFGEAVSVIDALVALNFVTSKKEARRMIQGGGARINGEAVDDENAMIAVTSQDVTLSAGKKKHGVLRFS
jgi:tyrosyl-tRNA synthetase